MEVMDDECDTYMVLCKARNPEKKRIFQTWPVERRAVS